MYGEQCVQAPAQGLELAPRLFVLPPLLWPRQRPGAAESLLLHQPRTENPACQSRTRDTGGTRVAQHWGRSHRDVTPAADCLDCLVVWKDRLWYGGQGWIVIYHLLQLTGGNGLFRERRPAPRTFPGKNTVSRTHPGPILLNIIQRPQFISYWILYEDGTVTSSALKCLKCKDAGRRETWG